MEENEDSAGQCEQAVMEWGIFRKGDASSVTPSENLTYSTREAAERTIKRSYREPKCWEVRGREIGPWDVKAREVVQ